MKRILLLVEGQTEERFIKDVLSPYLWNREVIPIPKIVTTKKVKCGPDFKGGITDYQKVENDLMRLLGDTGASFVTSFIDYYHLPADFPGMSNRPNKESIIRAKHVEKAWEKKINHPRFKSYLMVHEFEALLFSNPEELCRALYHHNRTTDFQNIRDSFQTPEDIDDDPKTAPSKRILNILPGYHKSVHGPLVAQRIGLKTLRSECPHFNEWLSWLENI